ncbi:DUF6082 family protein [bacterium]|nr:DUF6082 family protein [bacterium]
MTITEKISIGLLIIQIITFVAILATLIVYYRQLRTMEAQLRASSGANSRLLHVELIKLAIDKPDLLRVWHANHSELSLEDFRAHLFVNLHLSNLEAFLAQKAFTKEEVEIALKHHSANPYYRAFWHRVSKQQCGWRDSKDENTQWFCRLCDRIFAI